MEIAKIIKRHIQNNGKTVAVEKAQKKDEVQKDARNEANPFIRKWWKAKTSIEDGIEKIFEEMKKKIINYVILCFPLVGSFRK